MKSVETQKQNIKSNANGKQKLVKFKSIYMQQASPQNPFGPNYRQLPLNTKIQYKFSIAKQFIKLSSIDNQHKQIQEQKFLGTLIMGFVGGYFIAQIPRMIYSKVSKKTIKRGWPIVFSICAFSSYGYILAHQRYFQQVPKKLLNKYLKQAIQNGFQDYQISTKQ